MRNAALSIAGRTATLPLPGGETVTRDSYPNPADKRRRSFHHLPKT